MHGTFKGDPPRRDRGGGGGSDLSLAFRILLREATFGSVLYATLGQDPRMNVLLCAVVWGGLALLTRWKGLLNRKDRMGLFIECLVVFCGALMFRNLLILLPTFWAARH